MLAFYLLAVFLAIVLWHNGRAGPKPAIWDRFLARPPGDADEADQMSLYLNRLYRENLRLGSAETEMQWWAVQEIQGCDENIRRALESLSSIDPTPLDSAWKLAARRFIAAYSREQRSQAALGRTRSEVGDWAGELTGRELPDRHFVLTFDDGPHPTHTAQILTTLHSGNYPAVFFVIGKNLSQALSAGTLPDYRGCLLGGHSFSHPFLPQLPEPTVQAELKESEAEFARAQLPKASFFRAPFGARGERELRILKQMGLRSVLWNVDSMDWNATMRRRPGRVAARTVALALLRRRGIILMHDNQSQTPHELKYVLKALQNAGFHFQSLKNR